MEDSTNLMSSLVDDKESFGKEMAERHTSNIVNLVTVGLEENNSIRAERERYKRIAIALLTKCREQGLLHSLHSGLCFTNDSMFHRNSIFFQKC